MIKKNNWESLFLQIFLVIWQKKILYLKKRRNVKENFMRFINCNKKQTKSILKQYKNKNKTNLNKQLG